MRWFSVLKMAFCCDLVAQPFQVLQVYLYATTEKRSFFWWLIHNYFCSSEVLTSPESSGEGHLGHCRTAHLSSTKKMRSLFSAASPKSVPGRAGDMGMHTCLCFRDIFCAKRIRDKKNEELLVRACFSHLCSRPTWLQAYSDYFDAI